MAAGTESTLIFPPMVYNVDESGLKIGSHMIFSIYGAVFKLKKIAKMMVVFLGGKTILVLHSRVVRLPDITISEKKA